MLEYCNPRVLYLTSVQFTRAINGGTLPLSLNYHHLEIPGNITNRPHARINKCANAIPVTMALGMAVEVAVIMIMMTIMIITTTTRIMIIITFAIIGSKNNTNSNNHNTTTTTVIIIIIPIIIIMILIIIIAIINNSNNNNSTPIITIIMTHGNNNDNRNRRSNTDNNNQRNDALHTHTQYTARKQCIYHIDKASVQTPLNMARKGGE